MTQVVPVATGGGPVDVNQQLLQRLALYEDWNARLQLQLQQLLRLPHNDLDKLSAKMKNPDVAVPLLQCYDAALQEKQEELDAARKEAETLRAALRTAQCGHEDATQSARLAEQLARTSAERLHDEQQRARDAVEQLHSELQAVKHRAKELVEKESTLTSALMAEKARVLDATAEVEALRSARISLEEQLAAAHRKLKSVKLIDDEEKHVSETQAIQLQLIAKENDDKMAEIERLRNKMIHALKQQQDNHTTHLKIVEEKHRSVVEALREELRSQEVTALKLRAQLARADVNIGHNSGVGGGNQLALRTTTELLDSQSRQALELEVKRLYSELTAAQLQRDDASYRYEQLVTSRRTDMEDRVAEARRELDVQRAKTRDAEERLERAEAELSTSRDQVRHHKEKAKGLQSELQVALAEKESALRRADESKKSQLRSDHALEQAKAERDEAVAAEHKVTQAGERRLSELRAEEAAARDKLKALLQEKDRQLEALQQATSELQVAKQVLATQAQEKDRQLDLQKSTADKLTVGIRLCKEQLVQCDEKLTAYAAMEAAWKRDGRQLALHIEQLKLELARSQRDRERMAHELRARKMPQ